MQFEAFFSFKVCYFPILLLNALFTLYPSAENNYTFYFGPSALGACLIDKGSLCLVTMCRFMFCTLELSRNAFPQGAWVGVQRIVKRSLLSSRKKRLWTTLENHSSSFHKVARIHGKRCKCLTNHWETLQCILKYSNVLNHV